MTDSVPTSATPTTATIFKLGVCASDTETTLTKLIPAGWSSRANASELLMWMDACACVSAEKHSELPSVTVSMDDMAMGELATLVPGDIVFVTAKVTRAFNTSMEVICKCERELEAAPGQGLCEIAVGFFTFVSIGADGKRTRLPPILAETNEEIMLYDLAHERRRIRIGYAKHVKDTAAHYQKVLKARQEEAIRMTKAAAQVAAATMSVEDVSSGGGGRGGSGGGGGGGSEAKIETSGTGTDTAGVMRRPSRLVRQRSVSLRETNLVKSTAAASTTITTSTDTTTTTTTTTTTAAAANASIAVMELTTTELVLPAHTNHHGTTFGGQIMAWLANTSRICAMRFARRADLHIVSVDDVHFVGPSHVGDRVVISTRVNFCDGHTLEVGAQAEAYVVGGEPRLITRSFMTFCANDSTTDTSIDIAAPAATAAAAKSHTIADSANSSTLLLLPELPVVVTNVADTQASTAAAEEETRLRSEAVGRRRVGLLRRQLASGFFKAPSVFFEPEAAPNLTYTCVAELLTLYADHSNWKSHGTSARARTSPQFFTRQIDDHYFVRLESTFEAPPQRIYNYICDPSTRSEYDDLCEAYDTVRQISNEDAILHLKRRATVVAGQDVPPCDLLLLRACRAPREQEATGGAAAAAEATGAAAALQKTKNKAAAAAAAAAAESGTLRAESESLQRRWIVSHRSVEMANGPRSEGYVRQHTMASGFVISQSVCQARRDNTCHITYILNINGDLFKYLSADVVGATAVLEAIFLRLKARVEDNGS